MKAKHQSYILFILMILFTTLLTGCKSDPVNFSVESLTVTLNKSFTQEKHEGFDLYAQSDNIIFSAVEETFHELEYSGFEILSLKDYCSEILSLNQTSDNELKSRGNYYYFTNEKTVSGASYTYVHCMYEGNSSYWICEFVCKTKHYNRYKDDIFKWADSVTIAN